MSFDNVEEPKKIWLTYIMATDLISAISKP